MSRGLIVTGGNVSVKQLKTIHLQYEFDTILGVDRGIDALYHGSIVPDRIIGDFDSCRKDILEYFEGKGVAITTFPSKKDMTDTELALVEAIRLGLDEVIVLGAMGTRIDHTLGNLMVMSRYGKDIHLCVMDINNRIQWVYDKCTILKSDYKYVSLVPTTQEVTEVNFIGVKYPLKMATLIQSSSYGISNEIIESEAKLSIKEGILMVVESID